MNWHSTSILFPTHDANGKQIPISTAPRPGYARQLWTKVQGHLVNALAILRLIEINPTHRNIQNLSYFCCFFKTYFTSTSSLTNASSTIQARQTLRKNVYIYNHVRAPSFPSIDQKHPHSYVQTQPSCV